MGALLPKSTFHNLSEIKQASIVDAALDEFSQVPFEAASVNRIVRGAGIAKGSFYQYFDDLLDLYQHVVITVGNQRKEAVISGMKFDSHSNFFAQFTHACVVSLRVGLAQPKLLAAEMALRGPVRTNSALMPLVAQYQDQLFDAFKAALEIGVQRGAVRDDVDLVGTAMLLTTVAMHGLEPMMRKRLGFNVHDLIADPTLCRAVEDAHLEGVVDALIAVIIRGIRATPESDSSNPNIRHDR